MGVTENLVYYWLGISGITSRRANALLSKFSPLELWEKIGTELTNVSAFGEQAFDALIRYRNEDFLLKSIEKLDNMGISFITFDKFPELLAQREVDPPTLLYYKGDISLINSNCIGVVGTRECSIYGKEATYRLVTDLCKYNVTIVSGLAHGIDTYAHRATLKAGGKTIAVLGSGLNCIAPQSNFGLSEEIVGSGGLVITEYLPRKEANRFTFPERNRIISGLSMGVIVVEAGFKSGALITADYACEQNRTLFAVPGNITSASSIGSNRLLCDGAVPALSAEDVCEALNLPFRKIKKNTRSIQLDIFEQKIYNILLSGEKNFDSLVLSAEMAPQKLTALLSLMELKGIVKRKQSNIFCLA